MEGDDHDVAREAAQAGTDVDTWPTGRLLSVAARVVESRFDQFLHTRDLTHAGLIVLHHLAESPRSQRELAGLCRVTDQTMSRTIERLTRTGHTTRDPDKLDRRRTVVTITDAGVDSLAAARLEERKSEQLLGAVDDYDHFRQQLITLITLATRPPQE